jgi:hypothetical protein
MDALDLTKRSTDQQTFFDIGRTVAVSWGPLTAWFVAALALACGVLAWFKVMVASVRMVGIWRWILDAAWALVGVVTVAAAMIGGTWALRLSRTVYHPWYAHPQRMFLMLLGLGVLAGWLITRVGALLPARAHGPRHPVLVWSLTLPVWIVFAGVVAATAPSAGYLWSVPLLVAGVALLAVPVTHVAPIRAISVLILAVAGTLWLRDVSELLRFLVALFGRLPIVTPVWIYAVLMLAAGAMIVPPFIAAIAATKPMVRPSLITAALLVVVAIAMGVAYAAPAYTFAQPQRRSARVLVEPDASTATYEVASQEPGLDLDPSAPGGWYRATDEPKTSVPTGRYALPFVFRTTAPTPGAAPASVTAFVLKPVAGGTDFTMTIVPRSPGLAVVVALPAGVRPVRANLPGRVVRGRWWATYIGVPAEGMTFRAAFKTGAESRLLETRAIVSSSRFPGGGGWQSLPAWLPQEHVVWDLDVAWIIKPPDTIAPVPPLR